MGHIRNLSYIVIEVADVEEWTRFAVDMVGMKVGRKTDTTCILRMDQYAARIILKSGPSNDIEAMGWEVSDNKSLEDFVARAAQRGLTIGESPRERVVERQVSGMYECTDPNGVRQEFVYGPPLADGCDPYLPTVVQGGFRTGRHGMGHILLWGRNYAQMIDFYQRKLDLGLSGHMSPEGGFEITFLHSAGRAFHSVAIADHPVERCLGHIGIEVNLLKDVGYAYDRAARLGVPIAATLGHHPNAKTTSFYMDAPGGFEVEIGWGEIELPEEWRARRYLEYSDWGHHRSAGL